MPGRSSAAPTPTGSTAATPPSSTATAATVVPTAAMIAGPPGIESTSEPGSGAGTCGDSCLGRSGAEVGERGGANVDLDVDFAVPRYRIEFGFRLADIGINLDLGLGVLSSLSILALALALVGVRIDINLGVPMGKLLLDDVSPPPGRLADIIGTE